MKRMLTSVIFASLFLFSVSHASAQTEYEVGFETINPGNPMFYVKRAFEKIQVRFKDSPEFKYKLLERRHRELIFLAENERLSQMERATDRYMTQVGTIIDSESIIESQSDLMNQYVENLEKARDLYEANSAYWLFLQQSSELTSKLITSEPL